MLFDCPVYLQSGEAYKIISDTNGHLTPYSIAEVMAAECAGVTFTFNSERGFGYSDSYRHFSALIFSA